MLTKLELYQYLNCEEDLSTEHDSNGEKNKIGQETEIKLFQPTISQHTKF